MSGISVRGLDILNELMSISGIQLKTVIDKSKIRPTDAPDIYGSHHKITKDTGWVPEIPLEKTLKDVIASM